MYDCEVLGVVPYYSLGNPLEEKHSADGTWRDEVSKRLPKLKKLDGECLGPCHTTPASPLQSGVVEQCVCSTVLHVCVSVH